ncbi:hypothetical protein [Xanthobacter sp.]|uniref:hypothetical protein n=1 Tax=Xanthobacter sp. TaxID=35809 RepID=UPI0035B4585D
MFSFAFSSEKIRPVPVPTVVLLVSEGLALVLGRNAALPILLGEGAVLSDEGAVFILKLEAPRPVFLGEGAVLVFKGSVPVPVFQAIPKLHAALKAAHERTNAEACRCQAPIPRRAASI